MKAGLLDEALLRLSFLVDSDNMRLVSHRELSCLNPCGEDFTGSIGDTHRTGYTAVQTGKSLQQAGSYDVIVKIAQKMKYF